MATSQKLYITPNIDFQYSGLSFVKISERNTNDFKRTVPLLNYILSIDVFYKPKKFIHKITLEYNRFGDGFKVINKFLSPTDIGTHSISHSGGFEHFILSYNLGIESKKLHNPLGKLKIRCTCSLGFGIGFNKSKSYYNDIFYPIDFGLQDRNSYIAYLGTFSRTSMGIFSIINTGFDITNRKNKRMLSFSFFYNKGFSEMIKYNIHYQYGLFNEPNKMINVPNQTLRSRGTSFGLKIGIPIKILN
jgi:hypothetical protein